MARASQPVATIRTNGLNARQTDVRNTAVTTDGHDPTTQYVLHQVVRVNPGSSIWYLGSITQVTSIEATRAKIYHVVFADEGGRQWEGDFTSGSLRPEE